MALSYVIRTIGCRMKLEDGNSSRELSRKQQSIVVLVPGCPDQSLAPYLKQY